MAKQCICSKSYFVPTLRLRSTQISNWHIEWLYLFGSLRDTVRNARLGHHIVTVDFTLLSGRWCPRVVSIHFWMAVACCSCWLVKSSQKVYVEVIFFLTVLTTYCAPVWIIAVMTCHMKSMHGVVTEGNVTINAYSFAVFADCLRAGFHLCLGTLGNGRCLCKQKCSVNTLADWRKLSRLSVLPSDVFIAGGQ